MGRGLLKNGAQMRRIAIMAIRVSYKSVRNHPILVGSVLWLLLLYRSFPFLFSVLVSASPVLFCTALLLGTLLSFGQPELPHIDKDVIFVPEWSNLRTGRSEGDTLVERGDGDDEGYIDEKGEVVGNDFEVEPLLDDIAEVDLIEQSDGFGYCLLPGDLASPEVGFEMQLSEDVGEHHKKLGVIEENEDDEETEGDGDLVDYGEAGGALEKQDSIEKELNVENAESGRSFRESLDFSAGYQFESLLMPWKQLDDDHDGNDADYESLDSGLDGSESSSPDASMADIIPMLDELHPLLDSKNTQHPNLSHDNTVLPTEGSIMSEDDNNVNPDVDVDVLKEGVFAADNDGDGGNEDDHEEETQEVKEDETKSGITWTEDDQKNLMDLGISELKRNQRLENLIARRRARKQLEMMGNKNLIDFDGLNLPFIVAPISTIRQNPFDLSNGSSDDMGLPPVPGSAPSLLQPRQNPFDLPYDPGEEKPDLRGDSFQEEFLEFTHDEKGRLFRRHESFNMGSSSFEYPGYEARRRGSRHASRFRPYFITEKVEAEGTSSLFQRMPSDLSDSKLSSVAETESSSAVIDEDESKLIDNAGIAEETERVDQVLSSEDFDSVSDNQSEERDFGRHLPEIRLGGMETHPSSRSDTGEAENLLTAKLRATGSYHRVDTWMPEGEYLVDSAETYPSNTHLGEEIKDKHHSSASLSSLSEEDDAINGVKVDLSLLNVLQETSASIGSLGTPIEHLVCASNSSHASQVEDEIDTSDPIFDSSPRDVKSHSSSYPSGFLTDASNIALLQLAKQQRDIFASEESEVLHEVVEKGSSELSGFWSSNRLLEVKDIGDHEAIKYQFSRVDKNFGDADTSLAPENIVNLGSTSTDSGLVEPVALESKVLKSEVLRTDSYQNNIENQVKGQEENKNILEMPSYYGDIAADHVKFSSMVDAQTKVVEANIEEEDLKRHMSSSYADNNSDVPETADRRPVSTLEETDSVINNSYIPVAYGAHEEEGPTIITGKREDLIDDITENVEYLGLQESMHKIVTDHSYIGGNALNEEHGHNLIVDVGHPMEANLENSEIGIPWSVASSAYIQPGILDAVGPDDIINYEISDINGIDERLLIELDTVDDFSMKEAPVEFNHDGRHPGLPEVYSGLIDQDTFEVKASGDVSSVGLISLGDDSFMERQDTMGERIDNLVDFSASDLLSYSPFINPVSPISRDGSTRDLDAASVQVTEPEVEKIVINESLLSELTRDEIQHISLKSVLSAASVDPSDVEVVNAKLVNVETQLGSPGFRMLVNETDPQISDIVGTLVDQSVQKNVAKPEAQYIDMEPTYVESDPLTASPEDSSHVEDVCAEPSHADLGVREIELGSSGFRILDNDIRPQIPIEATTFQDHAIQRDASVSDCAGAKYYDSQLGSLESGKLNVSSVDASCVGALNAGSSKSGVVEETQLSSPGFKMLEDEPQIPIIESEDCAIQKSESVLEESYVENLSTDLHEENVESIVLQSGGYDPSSLLDDVTEVSKHGGETVLQHPDTELLQNDRHISEFAIHEYGTVEDVHMPREQYDEDSNLDRPTSVEVDNNNGNDLDPINSVQNSLRLEEFKKPSFAS